MYVSSAMTSLNPGDRANFTTTARLLSRLVTESLLPALYFPVDGLEATGVAVILTRGSLSTDTAAEGIYDSANILAIAPLCGVPIVRRHSLWGNLIGLLHPLDMLPGIFEAGMAETHDPKAEENRRLKGIITDTLNNHGWSVSTYLIGSTSPLSIWNKFATSVNIDLALQQDFSTELENCVKWQQYAYENPPPAPLLSSLSIDWEQSVVGGHPTYPVHRMRLFQSPLPDYAPGTYDLNRPMLRLIAVPKEDLAITGDFEKLVQPIVDAISKNAGRRLSITEGHVIIPVLELQLVHIQDKFKDSKIVIYPEEFSIPTLAQLSIRTVIIPDVYPDFALKLPLGIKLANDVRLINAEYVQISPWFSKEVVPFLSLNPKIVTVARELASVIHVHSDVKVSGHCGAIVRESHERAYEERGERVIVCAALTEYGHQGEGGDIPAVIRVFELNTEEKRLDWLSKYSRMLFEAFLPPVMQNGVGFECHPQNILARFDITTKELHGFIIRDLEGIRVHIQTLKASTGIDLDISARHRANKSLKHIYHRLYTLLVNNLLHTMIRTLGLHYNGLGWKVVREHLDEVIPKHHALYAAWLAPDRGISLFTGLYLRRRTGVSEPDLVLKDTFTSNLLDYHREIKENRTCCAQKQ